MKPLLAFIVLITFFFSKQAFSQEITYKQLIGTWDRSDTAEEKLSFKFMDASNLIVRDFKKGSYNLTYKLSTNNKGKSIIAIEYNTNGIKRFNNYAVENININTLRLVNLDSYNGVFEKKGEVNKGTFYLMRKSG